MNFRTLRGYGTLLFIPTTRPTLLSMMNLMKRAPAVEPAPVGDARLVELRGLRRGLMERISGLKTAAALISPTCGFGSNDFPSKMREAAKPFMNLSRRKLDSELDRAEHELSNILPNLADAAEDARRAAIRTTKDKARELEPEHRAAVKRIADALETLVDAMADETRIREQTDLNGIGHLPFLSLPVLGIPANPSSLVSRWFADARRAKYLE